MTSRINNIKDKFIVRDYIGIINEIIYAIELKFENIEIQQENQELNNKINQLKSYKLSLKNT